MVKMKRLYLIVVCLSICLLQSAKSEIAIYADFPGGNVFVEKIQNDTVWVRPDIRNTEGFWFYWYFAVKYDVGKSLTFVFPPDCFTHLSTLAHNTFSLHIIGRLLILVIFKTSYLVDFFIVLYKPIYNITFYIIFQY